MPIKRMIVIIGDVTLSELRSVRFDEWVDLKTISIIEEFELKYQGNKYRVFTSNRKLSEYKDVKDWLEQRILIQEFTNNDWIEV